MRAADRQDLLGFDGAQQLRLESERKVADLVEEDRAASRACEQASWAVTAPVNAPRTCPKSWLSSRVSGMAAQLTGRNTLLAASL